MYEHRSTTQKYGETADGSYRIRRHEFYFLASVIVTSTDCSRLVQHFHDRKALDISAWTPPLYTDEPYVYESLWRNTWPQCQWRRDVFRAPDRMPIMFPVLSYQWESHLDASLPNGARALIPSPWLAKKLAIAADRYDASICRNMEGEVSFWGSELGEHGSSALIETCSLKGLLDSSDLQCVWLFIGERGVYPGESIGKAVWRRSEGLFWLENGKPNSMRWNHDHGVGGSAVVKPMVP